MKQSGMTSNLTAVGLLALILPLVAPMQAAANPMTVVESDNNGMSLLVTADSDHDILALSIRVVGPGSFVFEDRIERASYEWTPPLNLPDGRYTWEAWVVTARPGAPNIEPAELARSSSALAMPQGEMATASSTEVQRADLTEIPIERFYHAADKNVETLSGRFEVQGGMMLDAGSVSEPHSQLYEPSMLQRAAGAILNWMIPSAYAQTGSYTRLDLEANSSLGAALQHLDQSGNADWIIRGNNQRWRLWDGQTSQEPFYVESGAHRNSIYIRGQATGEAGSPRVGVGTSTPTNSLHIAATGVVMRLQNTSEAQDWYINNSNQGRFEIRETVGGGIGAFAIDAGAPEAALFVRSNGNVGIGTDNPQRDLHIMGNHIRIENTGSTWDFNPGGQGLWFNRANPTTFGILKLQNDAPENSIVAAAGGVGIGTANPTAPIHIRRADDTFEMLFLEQANTSVVQDRNMMQLNNNGGIRFEFLNSALDTTWRFQAATGNDDVFEIAKVGTGQIELELDASGNLTTAGVISGGSSRTVKQDITPFDRDSLLDQLRSLDIFEWSYIRDSDGKRHLGPMAEDFYMLFGLGAGETTIAPHDLAGVALGSVKAMLEQLEAQQYVIQNQQDRIERLEARTHEVQAALVGLEDLRAELNDLKRTAYPLQASRTH